MVVDEGGASPVDPHESDGEESSALSLCDLPLMTDAGQDGSDGRSPSDPRRSPPTPDLFEFFFDDLSIDAAADMCAADDIFLRGQLLPYKPPPPPPPCPARGSGTHEARHLPVRHRRSESLGALDGPRGRLAAECRRLRRAASDSNPVAPQAARPRPRWYLFVLGSVRVPAAMEMRDIRSRQRRRSPPPASEKEPARLGCEGGSGPWRLLRSLSCKGLGGESAAVTAPFSSF